MYKVPTKSSVTLQQRRTAIALWIRLGVFLSVVSIYSLAVILNGSSSGIPDPTSFRHGRKILSSTDDYQTSTVPERFAHSTTQTVFSRSTNDNATRTTGDSPERHENCTPPAIDEFPSDGLTRSQRRSGFIVIHILLACYCFWFLAVVCDDYFVPAIEQICLRLQMPEDVAGATFMAAATSSAELFINCVGTFVTKGDIGVGTIVGSAVFNILAVPACCGLFAGQVIQLDWWPVSRDCLMYCVAVLGLIGTLYDGIVMWYEALILVMAYFFYITAMYWNDVMACKARKLISKVRRRSTVRPFRQVAEMTPLLGETSNSKNASYNPTVNGASSGGGYQPKPFESECDESDYADDPCSRNSSCLVMHLLRWPMTLLLWLSVPDSRRHPKCRFLTFAMSIAWIGGVSYVVAYLITAVGDTLSIPDSVMGLTILAAGMSVPEAVSGVIVTSQGHGAMGISNSIGSNTFDILLCLGLPWFIKSFFLPTTAGEHWVVLNSSGLTYSAISLLTTLFGLYIAFAANKFNLDWKVGVACSVMYIGFLILASMIELNVFFAVNNPICEH